MVAKNLKSNPSSNRWWILAGGLSLFVAISMILWNSGEGQGRGTGVPEDGKSGLGKNSITSDPQAGDAGSDSERANLTRSSRRESSKAADAQAPQFVHVQKILSDHSLSERQAAEGLMAIVISPELDEAERYEALAHGLNLDSKLFLDLTKDSQLPAHLAQRCFEELVGNNQVPKEQIEVCLNLMNHGDEEIRNQAIEQLAFLVENESLGTSPDELRKVATERLENLKAALPTQDQSVAESIDLNEIGGHEAQK